MQQKSWSFDSVTLGKIGKSLIMAIVAVFLTFVTNNLTEILGAFHLSAELQVYLSAVIMVTINAVREYIKGVPNPSK